MNSEGYKPKFVTKIPWFVISATLSAVNPPQSSVWVLEVWVVHSGAPWQCPQQNTGADQLQLPKQPGEEDTLLQSWKH